MRTSRALYAYLMTRDPENAAAPREPAALSGRLSAGDRGVEGALLPALACIDPIRRTAANGIAAPIWPKGSAIAAPATRRATPSLRRRADRRSRGGEAEGWHAPSLAEDSPAPVAWTADALFDYLRTGRDAKHGIAAGPMAPVVRNLAGVAPEDVHAIAI